jgi:uncharacterized protein with HEPN domain
MRKAPRDAGDIVAGFDKPAFLADKRTQQAVVMSLMIIGEAATQVMDRFAEFAAAHPDVPWRSMRGMRNRIAHGYFEIDAELVWETVRSALPDLLLQLEKCGDGGGDRGA